jgi:hypothetical protein
MVVAVERQHPSLASSSARIRDINPRQMRQALHQGSLTCHRFYRQVVEYVCGARPSRAT